MKKVILSALIAISIFTGCSEKAAPVEANVTEVNATVTEAPVEANVTDANVTETTETTEAK